MRALHRLLRELAPDLVVVAGMGWLLDRDALAVPRLGTLNVHPALLPAYRGAEPTFWQLFDAVAESGVTVHRVEPGEDRGPILRQQRFAVPPGTGLAQFIARQMVVGPPLLLAAVADTLEGRARPVAQPVAKPHAARGPPARRGSRPDRLAELEPGPGLARAERGRAPARLPACALARPWLDSQRRGHVSPARTVSFPVRSGGTGRGASWPIRKATCACAIGGRPVPGCSPCAAAACRQPG